MEYFDQAETWDRARIETTQLTRLRATLDIARRAPFYAQRLAEAGITPENLRSLDDVRRIPFTT